MSDLRNFFSQYIGDIFPSGCSEQCNNLTTLNLEDNAKNLYFYRGYCKKACDTEDDES